MEVVIVNLGDADKESDLEILDLLNTLFSLSTSSETKKKRLQKDFGIAMTEEFESEVQDMCNLGKALVEQGIDVQPANTNGGNGFGFGNDGAWWLRRPFRCCAAPT